MKKYNVYIDESGDEGFSQNSSKIFGFSAVVVQEKNDIILPRVQKIILAEIAQSKKILKNIHFHKFKHEERKFICKTILEKKLPIRVIVILSSKECITGSIRNDFNTHKYKYFNYMARMLLERISWLVRDQGGVATIPN